MGPKPLAPIAGGVAVVVMMLAGNSYAQEDGTPADVRVQEKLESLVEVLESIDAIQVQIGEQEEALAAARSDQQEARISEQIKELHTRTDELERDFSIIASGADRTSFRERPSQSLQWQEELEDIFSPIVVELREATSHPREVAMLHSELTYIDRLLEQADDALQTLGPLIEATADDDLADRLRLMEGFWGQQRQELESQRTSTLLQLAEKETSRRTVAETASEFTRLFFKSRGRNLLLAFVAMLVVFLLLRSLHRLLHRLSPLLESGSRPFLVRVLDLVYFVVTILASVSVVLAVLYITADWVLLGSAIIFLVAVAWASRFALPGVLEQAKLLLDIGPVREGERVIYRGAPWRVQSLNVFTDLINPDLTAGTIRLPLADIVGLRSRAWEEGEPWFPSCQGDWVVLADGTYGKVEHQSPDTVVIDTVRGSLKAYPMEDYLQQHPRNLSRNLFAVETVLSIDYEHRQIVNTEVIAKVKQALEEGFAKEWYGEHLVQTIVELETMSDSSLDIITIGKFTGEAASEWLEIHWKQQQIALDACNQHGWNIPFPQLTVHADPSATPLIDAPPPSPEPG